jgi:hypothetical protein
MPNAVDIIAEALALRTSDPVLAREMADDVLYALDFTGFQVISPMQRLVVQICTVRRRWWRPHQPKD